MIRATERIWPPRTYVDDRARRRLRRRAARVDLRSTSTPAGKNARTRTPTRGSRRSATCASTASRSATASRTAATRCGGSPSCISTRSRRSSTRFARSPRSTRWSSASGRSRSRIVSGRHPRRSSRTAPRARKVRYSGPGWPRVGPRRCCGWTRARAALVAAARLSRLRRGPRRRRRRARVAAFVHRAFWDAARRRQRRVLHRSGAARARRGVAAGDMRYVGVGPRTNFRARRWWDRAVAPPSTAVVRSSARAGRRARRLARGLPRPSRDAPRLWNSADLRAHAVIRGCDCWPLVREQLAGIALLQFPWSARAMDEAAAALDALEPDVARDLRRSRRLGPRARARRPARAGVPLAGLQHGFIYRHWLNYRHEPDEIGAGSAESGGSRVSRSRRATLLFDEHAARHLATAGRFPPAALAVTGSARLDELVAAVRGADAGSDRGARGATPARVERARWCSSPRRSARRGASARARRGSARDAGRAARDQAAPRRNAGRLPRRVAGAPMCASLPAAAPLPPLLARGARRRDREFDRGDRRAGALASRRSSSACRTT